MSAGLQRTGLLSTSLVLSIVLACSHPAAKVSTSWDRRAAATYLDYRESWWQGWMGSARDQGTFCVSCHTALPYALARPALRSALGESGPSAGEQNLVDNVTKRVRMWKEIAPYYSDQRYVGKSEESRGTESVLNALILANYDAHRGQLRDETRTAFDNMWAMQRNSGNEKGSWPWLQFDEEPWEAKGSVYYGAALAALAVGTAPSNYSSAPTIQANLTSLREYLNRESASQSILSRVFLLWASTKLPGVLNPDQQKAIAREVLARQQSDGGWRLASIAWSWDHWSTRSLIGMWLRADGTPMEGKSDGVATGLVTLVLREAGIPRNDIQLQRGISWLMSNQTPEGFWPASSVNKKRNPSSETARFMSDAGTAFSVMSLTLNRESEGAVRSASSR